MYEQNGIMYADNPAVIEVTVNAVTKQLFSFSLFLWTS